MLNSRSATASSLDDFISELSSLFLSLSLSPLSNSRYTLAVSLFLPFVTFSRLPGKVRPCCSVVVVVVLLAVLVDSVPFSSLFFTYTPLRNQCIAESNPISILARG